MLHVLPFEFCPNCDSYASESVMVDTDGENCTCYGCDSSFPMPISGENVLGKCDWCHKEGVSSFICDACRDEAEAHYEQQVAYFDDRVKQVKAQRYSMPTYQYKSYLATEVNDKLYWLYKLSRLRGEFYAIYNKGSFEQVTTNGKAVTRILSRRGYKVVVRDMDEQASPALTKAQWIKHLEKPQKTVFAA